MLLNDVAGISQPFALILDDYHVITTAIHQVLTFLPERLPPRMHLVITSRADPPLLLARLRVRRQVTEVREAALRLTLDEAADFLKEVMSPSLSLEDLTALEAHTEGWIAGLQLAALSMQGVTDPTGFIRSFGGSHRHIVDLYQSFPKSVIRGVVADTCDSQTAKAAAASTLAKSSLCPYH